MVASNADPEHSSVEDSAKSNAKAKQLRSEMLSRHQKEIKELQGKEIAPKEAAAKGSKAERKAKKKSAKDEAHELDVKFFCERSEGIAMPLLSSTPTKKKMTPKNHVGTLTPSLRRGVGVKPLGEHNRSRSHSPALGSLSVKDKRTPAKKTMLTGVDLTGRFADSMCSSRSPLGSPSLDRIQEGCSSSLRTGSGTAFKSRLRGDDTPPVNKAITFSTPRENSIRKHDIIFSTPRENSVRKHDKVVKRKDLSEHFAPKEDLAGRIVVSKELEGHSKLLPFSDLAGPKGIGLRGKLSDRSDRSSVHDRMAMGVGHRSFGASEGRAFIKDAPCRLAFDGIELSPSPVMNSKLERSDAATLSPSDEMLSPLPCKSPEVCSRGFTMDEDSVAQEWFHSPEAQPSESPELSKRAMGGIGATEVVPSPQQTPSPQPTNSPEFLKRGSVPPSSGGCFGAGPLMGPEGMRSVKDRRKCKPRGILTIEGELLFSAGSSDFEEVQVKETISVPSLASVEWMVAEGYEVEPPSQVREPISVPALASVEWMVAEGYEVETPSLKVSPGSFRESTASLPGHRRCRSAAESGSEQVFWKKGLLYEWNLSLSDQKRAESTPSPSIPETDSDQEPTVSPIGKLRDFS